MAPRPSSQKEPSSRRAISKSPKTGEAGGDAAASTASSNATRSRQARHLRFPFNGLPQIEQTTADAGAVSIVSLPSTSRQRAEQLVQLSVHLRVGVHGSAHLGA